MAHRAGDHETALSQALTETLEAAGRPGERWVEAASMLLVDAIVSGAVRPLEAFLDAASTHPEREALTTELSTLASVAQWGITRLLPAAVARNIDWDACEGRILRHLAEEPDSTSTDLATALAVTPETISRVGSHLDDAGLVQRTRAGKWLRWRLTTAGASAVEDHLDWLPATTELHIPVTPLGPMGQSLTTPGSFLLQAPASHDDQG